MTVRNLDVRRGARIVVTETAARAWLDWLSEVDGTVNVRVYGEVVVYPDGEAPPAEPA